MNMTLKEVMERIDRFHMNHGSNSEKKVDDLKVPDKKGKELDQENNPK